MAEKMDHDAVSGTATVVGESGKGALKGAGAAFLGVAAVVGGVVGVVAAALEVGFLATVATVAVAAVLAPVLLAGAGIGAALGLGGGVSKVRKEQKAFDKRMQHEQQNVAATIEQAQQQAYMAGTRDGQAHVINKIQEIQATQEQQTNFAAKFADKKGAVTPEAIIKQREAAATAPQQLGA